MKKIILSTLVITALYSCKKTDKKLKAQPLQTVFQQCKTQIPEAVQIFRLKFLPKT